MATVFSTATLGLQVDATQFKKQIQDSEKIGTRALSSLSASADAFSDRWGDLTAGIKDTKRIISGILVSQGFYALSNALLSAGAAALEFSSSMETASVSLEYFVDAADGTKKAAAQVQAYLREVNEFAARTPFSTDEVLSLSKYMQAVGVAMGQTQSVLEVITDTAAATGATNEQLQRITFALGQMITKGRVANEEIRQLANANIPIYQILQEELGLTGEQISNIGNYWIDANDAVVAILNGLNRRYNGAADRIADTLTGLTDTIVDDAKIIADSAFSGIYDKVVAAATTLRDTLDHWRDTVTSEGTGGLVNTILTDIDPTGEFGNSVLATVGNLRNLKDAFIELYHSASPLLNVIGKSFAASLNAGTIALTALLKVSDEVIDALNEMGLTTGTTGQAIASLYVAYQSAKFVSLLGQALASAGMSAYNAATGLLSLLPASMQANAGIVALTGSVAVLISYLLTAVGIFGMLNNSFSGLSNDGTSGLNSAWQNEYARYKAEMDAYNEQIEKYRESYREPYTDMGDSYTGVKKEEDDDSKSGSSNTANDWVAAFDEVYDVPDEDPLGTGDFQDDVLDDFGTLLQLLDGIVFPNYDTDALQMPSINFDNVFGENLWGDDYAGKSFWKTFLPMAILGGVSGIGQIFTKQRAVQADKLKNSKVDVGIDRPGALTDPKALSKALADSDDRLAKLLEKQSEALSRLDNDVKAFELASTKQAAAQLESSVENNKLLSKEIEKELASNNELRVRLSKPMQRIEQLMTAQQKTNAAESTVINQRLREINRQLADPLTATAQRQALREERNALTRTLVKNRAGGTAVDLSGLTVDNLADALTARVTPMLTTFNNAFTGALDKNAKSVRVLNEENLNKALNEFNAFYDEAVAYFKAIDEGAKAVDTVGTAFAAAIRPELDAIKGHLEALASGAIEYNGMASSSTVASGRLPDAMKDTKKFLEGMQEHLSKMTDVVRHMNDLPKTSLFTRQIEALSKRIESGLRLVQLDTQQGAANLIQQGENASKRAKLLATSAAEQRQTLSSRVLRNLDEISETIPERISSVAEEISNTRSAIRDFKREMRTTSKQLIELQGKRVPGTTDSALEHAIFELQDDMAMLRDSITKAEKSLAIQLAEQAGFGRYYGSTALPDAARGGSDAVKQYMQALNAAYMLPKTLSASATEAIDALMKTVEPRVRALFEKADDGFNGIFASGTKLEVLNNGIDAFSNTIPAAQRRMLASIGVSRVALDDLTSSYVKTTAALGNTLEPFVRHFAALKYADVMQVGGAGHLANADVPLVIQNDAVVKLLNNIVNGKPAVSNIITADIKTTSSKVIDTLISQSEDLGNGLREISAEALRVANKDNWYNQFAAGIRANTAAGDDTRMVLLTFKRDFDVRASEFNGLYDKWQIQIKQLVNNSNIKSLLDSVQGQIFSPAAVSGYANLRGGAYAALSPELQTEAYFAEVLRPLFTTIKDKEVVVNDALLKQMSSAIDAFVVKYTNSMLDAAVNPAALKSFEKLNEVLTVLSSIRGDNIDEYLQSVLQVTRDGQKTLSMINFDGVQRQYRKFSSTSVTKWFDSILGEGAGTGLRGSFSKQLRSTVDRLVSALNDGMNSADVSDAINTYTKGMMQLSTAARDLANGTEVTEEMAALFGNMAANPDKYRTALRRFADATEVLATTPQLVNETARNIRTVTDIANRVNAQIAAGLPVAWDDVNALAAGYQKAIEQLSLQGDKAARELGDRLYAIRDYLAAANGRLAVLPSQLSGSIDLPFQVLGIEEHAKVIMQQINDDIAAGIIKNLEAADKAVIDAANEVIGKLDVPVTDSFAFARKQLLDTAKTFFDIETAPRGGVPATGMVTAKGYQSPYPVSISATQPSDDGYRMFNELINWGHEQNVENLKFLQQTFGTDVYPDEFIVKLDEADDLTKVLERFRAFVGDTSLSGYNATNVGGFDLRIINDWAKRLSLDTFDNASVDVMRLVTERVNAVLGSSKNLTLVDAYELFVGELETAAHISENDALATAKLFKSYMDGTMDEILEAAKNIPGKNVFGRLQAAAEGYRSVAEATVTAADGTIDMGATLDALRKGNLSADKIASTVEELYSSLDDVGKATAKSAAADGLKEATKRLGDLDALINAYTATLNQATASGATKIADSAREQLLIFITERDKQAASIKAMQELLGTDTTVGAFKAADTAGKTFTFTDEAGKVFTGDVIDNTAKSASDLDELFRYKYAAAETGGTAALDDILRDLFDVTDEVDEVTKAGSAFKRSLEGVADSVQTAGSKLRSFFEKIDFSGAKRKAAVGVKTLQEAAYDVADAASNMAKEAAAGNGKITKAYRAAEEAYKVANNDFISSLFVTTNNAIKEGGGSFDDFLNAFSKDSQYIAYYFDEATGKFSSIGAKLSGSGDEFIQGLRKIAEATANGDESAKLLSAALGHVADAVDEGKPLSYAYETLASAQKDAFKKFARGSVIYNAADDVVYAGEYAAKQVSASVDLLNESIKGKVKDLFWGTKAGYGIIDFIEVGVDAYVQHLQDLASEDYAGAFVESTLSDAALSAIREAGVDTGKIVADSIYAGVTDTAVTTLLTAGISNVLIYAASVALGGIPGLLVGMGASIVSSMGIQSVLGTDQYSLSYGNWSNALEGGKNAYDTTYIEQLLKQYGTGYSAEDISKIIAGARFTDTETLMQQLIASGSSAGEAASTAFETALKNYDFQSFDFVANTPYDTIRGKNQIDETLYGSNQYYGQFKFMNDKPVEGLYNGEKAMLPMRLLAASGAVDVAEQVTSTSNNGITAYYHNMVVGVENAQEDLEKIKEAIGDNTLYLGEATEVDGKQYYVVRTRNVYDPSKTYDENVAAGTAGLAYDRSYNGIVQWYGNDLDTLLSAVRGVYEGGVQDSALANVITEAVDSSTVVQEALASAGISDRLLEAYAAMPEIVDMYNRINPDSAIAVPELDSQYGLASALVDYALKIQDAYEAEKLAQVRVMAGGYANDSVLKGNAAQYVFGANLGGISAESMAVLESIGLKVSEGQYSYNSALTGQATEDYVRIEAITDTLMENLRGMTIDLSGENFDFGGKEINLGSLSVTTAEAEILAQAGIQINDDGSWSFMRASYEEKTGSQRELGLNQGAFNEDLLAKMQKNNMTIDFTTGTLDFNGFEDFKNKATAAYFKMSDDVSIQLTDDMRKMLASVGNVTESGFFEITNKAVLSGNKSMTDALDALDWSGITNDVKTQLYNIAALIDSEGGSVQENIWEWANGITIPSPFNEAELTEEVKAGFAAVGVSFEEGANGLMMTISNTGEWLTNGVTLIDTEKWNSLSEQTLAALSTLGVQWTEVGNQTMVDLNGVYDAGIGNIVSLFVDQPDLWNQLPETVREVLGSVAVASGEELLEIQTQIGQDLVEISDGWITAWDALAPETAEALNALGVATDNGMLSIKGYVEGAEIPELLNNEVLVPFSELPPEVQAELEATGQNVEGMKYVLGQAAETGFSELKSVITGVASDVGKTTGDMVTDITTAVTEAMAAISNLQQLQSQVGKSGGFLGIGSKENLIDYTGTKVGSTTYYREYTSSGSTVKYWYLDSTGTWKTTSKLPGKAKGGPAAGYTLAGELGTEMAILPDGTIRWVDAGVYDFPAGTQIINAKDSAAVAKYAGNVTGIEKLADGNTELTMNAQEPDTESVYSEFIDLYRPILNEELRGVGELVAVSIKNAAETLVAEDDGRHDKLVATITSSADDLKTFIDSQRVSHEEMLSAAFNNLNSNLTSGLQQVASAVGATIESLKSTISSLEHSLAASSKTTNELLDTSVDYSAKAYEAAEKGDYEGMMKALSDRYTKVGIIGTDYGNSQAEVTAVAMSKYKNATIKANAYGGMVSDDQLVRVGEFGKKEAILPLEQPSVMASLGEEIGAYVGGLTAEQLQEILDEQLYTTRESLAVAIHNAAKILAEETTGSTNAVKYNHSELTKLITSSFSGLSEKLDAGLSGVSSSISGLSSSIASSISSSMRGTVAGFGSGSGKDDSGLSAAERAALGGSVYDLQSFSDDQLKAAQEIRKAAEAGETSWAEAHEFVESIRNEYGYSGGTDGSKYISTTNNAGKTTTVKASAYGSLVTGDQLVRVGEFGKREAILPLEQPSVMAKVGAAVGRYTSTALTAEVMSGLLAEALGVQSDELSVAIDNSAKIIGEELAGLNRDTSGAFDKLGTSMDAVQKAVTDNGSTIDAAVRSTSSSIMSEISSAASQIGSAVGSIRMSSMSRGVSGSSGGSGGSGSGSTVDRSSLGGSTYDQAHFTTAELQAAASLREQATAGTISWSEAHAGVESIRNSYGYSGGTDGSKYNKTKGSASGSLVTKDALYRAGELGLNEAIIPLEKPDIMRYVGSTIASYMPVEANELQGAIGMRNAGITAPSPAVSPMQEDMTSLVSDVTQHVLESVLPAMSNMGGGEEAKTPVYVGTLIADERGLKQLERKLYVIRKAEEARRQ